MLRVLAIPARAASLTIALALVAGCKRAPEPFRERLLVFGSEAELSISGVPAEQANRAIEQIAELMAVRNREWHAWEPSDLTRINAAFARGVPAPAPESVRRLIRLSQPLSRRSGGAFDPAIGGLIELWGFHTSDYPIRTAPPSAAEVMVWRARDPHISEIAILDDGTIASNNPAVQLDFGAIAEGAAAQEIAELLSRVGVANALITLGGDVLAMGDNAGRAWQVAIADPAGGILAGVSLDSGEALFTSGDYSKYRLLADGMRAAHILDPRTGEPARGTATAVVLHPDPVVADVAATALMVAGPSGFAAMAKQLGLRCAMLLSDDDTLWSTSAMRARVHLLRQPAKQAPTLDLGARCSPIPP